MLRSDKVVKKVAQALATDEMFRAAAKAVVDRVGFAARLRAAPFQSYSSFLQPLRGCLLMISGHEKLGHKVFESCGRGVAGCARFKPAHLSGVERAGHFND